ncbi:uncharacterized protein PV09_04459 [Verruconis gallopava]|uniref:SRR1-like domain-containing protein n=1 Tax=Verruconis gallopava TaxID=253628 RepID=A0A0D1YVJ3_9PEZI|nr:uncharacterized protein PV09_04459 [Verruconis gallopava]KIW04727.1 hypothetical protein PV09_04459 [Verruconis gallopava]
MRKPNKLGNIELSDGWSFVTRSKGGRPRKDKTPSSHEASGPDLPALAADVSRITEEIERNLSKFEDSSCAAALDTVVASSQPGSMETALCLGLGSLGPEPTMATRRSMTQFTVFLWLLKHLFTTGVDNDVRILAVDPSFTSTDKAVLEHFGVATAAKALHNQFTPKDCFFFAPYLPWPVLTLDYLSRNTERPKVIVCQDLKSVRENLELRRLEMASERAVINIYGRDCTRKDVDLAIDVCQEMVEKFNTTAFPPYDNFAEAFQNLAIYMTMKTEEAE